MMKTKYLENKEPKDWVRQDIKSLKGASNVWKGLVRAFDILGNWGA
jgi:hypothetical protein